MMSILKGRGRLRGLRVAGIFVVVLLGIGAAEARAQSNQDNPHGELGIECSECHSTSGWTPLREDLDFDHGEGGFELVQGHAELECLSCHQSLVFSHVASACADCHRDPHRGELGFDCEACHKPSSWDNRRLIFDVHGSTLFPLTGTHATLDCAACHRRQAPFEYATTPTDCVSCHVEDYQRADDPDHVAAGFPTDCQFCHNTMEWDDVEFEGGFGFDHSALFALTGQHRSLDCSDCHTGSFSDTPNECVGCHRPDYLATTDPDHQRAGIDTNCEDCHGTSKWEGAVLDHPFELTGSHRALDCESCHIDNQFEGTPTDCEGCHRADFNATTDPDHARAGFPLDCEACHTTARWEGAEVDHSSFALTGSHRSLDCESCHIDNQFEGTPTDCEGCHRADFDATRDPNHVAAGFPRDCEVCHDTSSWQGAEDIDHDFFPIYVGDHRQGSAWDSCSDCHTNSNNFRVFDCLSCHPRAEMEEEHDEVPDFSYQSPACLDCHPTGED